MNLTPEYPGRLLGIHFAVGDVLHPIVSQHRACEPVAILREEVGDVAMLAIRIGKLRQPSARERILACYKRRAASRQSENIQGFHTAIITQ